MSIVTTFTCDRCGHAQDNNTQMWEVAVLTQHLDNSKGPLMKQYRWLPNKTPIWCRKCIDAVGLLGGWKPPADAPETPPPTLEDQLREIIRDEIQASTGA